MSCRKTVGRAKSSEMRHFIYILGREKVGFRLRVQWERKQIKRVNLKAEKRMLRGRILINSATIAES